jgi:hypothetical protein
MARFHLTCLALLSTLSPQPLQAQRAVEIRRAVTSTASIRVSGAFAELRIHGWKRDSAVITGSIPNDARFDGGFITSTTLSTGAKFYLETASGVPSGKLDLYVPAGARIWAKSGSATIDVEGVTGGLDLNIIGGSVHVAGSPHDSLSNRWMVPSPSTVLPDRDSKRRATASSSPAGARRGPVR